MMNSSCLLPVVVAFVLVSISLCPTTATKKANSNSGLESVAQHLASATVPTTQFFQLQARSNGKCLALESHDGVYVPCSDQHSTIYFLNGDGANNYTIINVGKGQCLDRASCSYGLSNIHHSPACHQCGAINWNIRSDGSVTQGIGRNRTCIYSASSKHVALHPCSQGFEKFKILPIGDHFRIKSSHGDCLSGDTFVDCNLAHTYFVTGTPGNYSIRVYGQADVCLDKEHCHSSTSNLRFSKCSHCGAIQWSIEGDKIGEDGMRTCINRGGEIGGDSNEAAMNLCSDGYEELTLELILSPSSAKIQVKPPFRKPSFDEYRYHSSKFRGIKNFKYSVDGTLEIEFVHEFQYPFTQSGYHVQYMVTHVHTNILYSSQYSTNNALIMLTSQNQYHVTQINYRFGGVPRNHRGATWNGLTSEFVTNSGGVPLNVDYNQAITELFNSAQIGIGSSTWQDMGHQYYYIPNPLVPYPLYRQENNDQCRNNNRRGPGV